MGFFRDKTVAAAPAPGGVNLSKGGTVNLTKAVPGATVTLTCMWPDKTDYDLYALVQRADGTVEHIATFGAAGIPAVSKSKDGLVRHAGDQVRGDGIVIDGVKMATETMTVTMDPSIVAVFPVVYSAQSNGGGSFRKYGVTSTVSCGDQVVQIAAKSASANNSVYTMVPAIVRNTAGVVTLEAVEKYSKGGEHRPMVDASGALHMDKGPKNDYK